MKHVKCYIPEYPRPQLVRSDWQNLNGEWDFAFGTEITQRDIMTVNFTRKINVPFSCETKLSGIEETDPHPVLWYRREIEGKADKRTILNFEGADYDTEVYVNSEFVGKHRGGYSRFSFDVTDYLIGNKGVLTVKCIDNDLPVQIRGKQRWQPSSYGCWYVQTTGIWKTVWIEYVDDIYLTKLKITPNISNSSVTFDIGVSQPSDNVDVKIKISFHDTVIQEVTVKASDIDNMVSVRLDSKSCTFQREFWSFRNPALYDVELSIYDNGKLTDTVGSYFGLREITVRNGKLMLNGESFYSKLILDQGYWKESGMTPPSEQSIVEDIRLAKEMGFNGARKHQKNEDERFYYYADIMGFLIWCEMPSFYWFSDEAVKNISAEWLDIVTQNYNHPSLAAWVLLNESWGVNGIASNTNQQNMSVGLYYMTKSVDSMRPVISNDGWLHTKSDLITIHHYEQNGDWLLKLYDNKSKLVEGYAKNFQLSPFANGYKYDGQPVIFTEFGGIHYAKDEGWGYGTAVQSNEEFLKRFDSLVKAIESMDICGYCYTQLTDVEQETNGLLTYDRKPKIDVEKIREILS